MSLRSRMDMLRGLAALAAALAAFAGAAHGAGPDAKPEMSPEAKPAPHSNEVFGPDPTYEDKPYSVDDQLKIYGGKFKVKNPRPMLELGRPIYEGGPLQPSGTGLGRKNPTDHAFSIYGDWRTALARNSDGTRSFNVLATRLNLDVDWKLTGTERLHAFFRPLDHKGNFTRCQSRSAGVGKRCDLNVDVKADALFFEGDLGAMMAGWTDRYQSFDLPIAVGKMPLLFQNGVWLEDAISGFAFTLPGKNSKLLDISNVDVTFFAGLDNVNTPGIVDAAGNATGSNRVLGATAFIEANQGYWELGMARVAPKGENLGRAYNNFAVAFTRRYGGWLSNSVRVIHNSGQDPAAGQRRTANGTLLLIENSLVTRQPLTLVPYLNLFYGKDRPQSVARAVDAGGILKNTGINFETDGLTGFPRLDDTANNTYGGALGIEYLFDLSRQLVVEVASVRPHGDVNNRAITGAQTALGIRYQHALDRAWILRADLILADRANLKDIGGIRLEIRRKF
jgi:hypothetical protein